MNHLVLFIFCILCVQVFISLNFLQSLDLILNIARKAVHVISQNNVSDHWKEKIIPVYALRIAKHSLRILLVLLFVMSLFLIADFFFNGLFELTISLTGVSESLVFATGYVYLRRLLINE